MQICKIYSSKEFGVEFDEQICKMQEMNILKKIVGEDKFTQLSRYIAQLLVKDLDYDNSKCGVIYVTEYGNVSSMIKLSSLAKENEFISARLFPNATIGSASVIASQQVKSKGLNVTIGAGFLGFFYGVELANYYLSSGQLDICLILTGDSFDNEIVCADVMRRNKKKVEHCIVGTLVVSDAYAARNRINKWNISYSLYSKESREDYEVLFDNFYCHINGKEMKEDVCESSYLALRCKEIIEQNVPQQSIFFGEVKGIDVVMEFEKNEK